MCNFSPSPQMSRPEITPELARAFDDLRIAAAIHIGWNPEDTKMTLLRPRRNAGTPARNEGNARTSSEISNLKSQIVGPADPEFFYAQHTY